MARISLKSIHMCKTKCEVEIMSISCMSPNFGIPVFLLGFWFYLYWLLQEYLDYHSRNILGLGDEEKGPIFDGHPIFETNIYFDNEEKEDKIKRKKPRRRQDIYNMI